MSENGFRFGDWQIDPDSNTLRNDEASASVEPKAMEVLRYLCRHAGAVIPPEELLQACWGNAELGDNPIHKAITQLRRALGDSASEPRYIETVRKRGYRAIAPVMTGEAALEGSWQQGSPFRGLESFQESHAAVFFGRLQATAQLRELVLKQASDGCAMALVLGPSGSGKTSLVRAGLLPGLMASRTGSGEPVALTCTLYMDCADLADGNLFQALAAVLIDAEVGGTLLFADENAEGLGRWLESSDASTIAGRFKEASGRIKIGLFIDRLEAIFRVPGVTDQIRSRFIAVLEHLAVTRAVLVMLACRNDFYPEVIALPLLMALKSRGGHFDLNPPDGAEIAQMVRMPAKAAGLKFEVDAATGAALDDVLCDAARASPDTLPLLQYCLNELYRQRAEDGTLLFAVLGKLGGIEGAIAVRAEQVLSELNALQAPLQEIFSLIVDVAEESGLVTARRATWSALPSQEARDLLQALVEARLFVSELSGEVPSFGVAHEALLRRWPSAQAWIEQHRQSLQNRAWISREANRWAAANKPSDLLLSRGSRLNQAKELLSTKQISLTAIESEFVEKSVYRARINERIRFSVVATFFLLAILAGVLGIMAKRAQAQSELHRAEAEGLMSFMLGDFVEKLRPIGKLELLNDVSKKALTYLSANDVSEMSGNALMQRVKALQIIASVNIARNAPEVALQALETAERNLQTASALGINQAELIKLQSSNYFYFGQIQLNRNDLTAAGKYFNQYDALTQRLTRLAPENSDAWLEQSYALSNLGTIAMRQGNSMHAMEKFEQSVALKRKFLLSNPAAHNVSIELADSLSWLASAFLRQGKFSNAEKYSLEQIQILTGIKKTDPSNAQISIQLAKALALEAELKILQGKPGAAVERLRNAESLLLALIHSDTTNKKWEFMLIRVQLRLVDAEAASLGNVKALERIEAVNHRVEALLKEDPQHAELALTNARANYRQATFQVKENNHSQAVNDVAAALTVLNRMHAKNPNDTVTLAYLAEAVLVDADVSMANNEYSAMQRKCKKAQDLILPALEKNQSYWLLAPLVKAFTCTDEVFKADPQKQILKEMNYLEPSYTDYLLTHPVKKGMQ